jgi:hypothetical protein
LNNLYQPNIWKPNCFFCAPTQTRSRCRMCNNPSPRCNGKSCSGSSLQYNSQTCNTHCCRGKRTILINKYNPATYIEIPVPTQENERSRNMCVRCIDFTSVYDFSSWIWNCSDSVLFFVLIFLTDIASHSLLTTALV